MFHNWKTPYSSLTSRRRKLVWCPRNSGILEIVSRLELFVDHYLIDKPDGVSLNMNMGVYGNTDDVSMAPFVVGMLLIR